MTAFIYVLGEVSIAVMKHSYQSNLRFIQLMLKGNQDSNQTGQDPGTKR